jgi:isocitrate dehydrogenase kinase/phosphatase
VFYDYDEIAYLTDINFRRIPPPRTPEDELAAEPWYAVAANDVFPEEFGPFLLAGGKINEHFLAHHRDLLTPEYWNVVKARVAQGEVGDVFPYPEAVRFARRFEFRDQRGVQWQIR